MDGFPKGLLIGLVLLAGVVVVVIFRPPHRLCDSKLDMLRELQKGKVFAGQGKNMARSPKTIQAVESCKLGNSPGACFEFFNLLKGLDHDLQGIPAECSEDLKEVSEISFALKEGMSLLVQIAWGEEAPEKTIGPIRQGWLESSDLALFCHLKELYLKIYGQEEMDLFRPAVFSKLQGQAPMFQNGECVNCEFRKMAPEILKPDEIKERSLFSLRCELYR